MIQFPFETNFFIFIVIKIDIRFQKQYIYFYLYLFFYLHLFFLFISIFSFISIFFDEPFPLPAVFKFLITKFWYFDPIAETDGFIIRDLFAFFSVPRNASCSAYRV